MHDQSLRSVPLGGLGTGAIEICSDGRFRNLSINNNRNLENRIPIAPHSFLAVRASDGKNLYLRRIQTALPDQDEPDALYVGGLAFRGHYPQADGRVNDPEAPIETIWSAFSPVVPYDYEASALPLALFALQLRNHGPVRLDVSAVFNWQNTCGHSASRTPEALRPILRETVITEADWDRMTKGGGGDNERRLSAKSGRVESGRSRPSLPQEIRPNALVYGDARAIDANEDGQYCAVTSWSDQYRTSLAIWDPDEPASATEFWEELASGGEFSAEGGEAAPRCGAICNRFALEPGQSRSVEFVLSWYCPRYDGVGPDDGNYYANNYTDAPAIARVGLVNGKYYFAAVQAWQHRLATSDIPGDMVRRLLSCCEVLSTNSVHTRNGDFGLFESLRDPRVNPMRDRWYWSMGLLLFYPRLELEILERLGQRMAGDDPGVSRIGEGLEGLTGGESVAPGAAQVETGAYLVTMTYRNFLFGGNISSIARLAPRLQSVMAALLAQDKDLDGFPDIEHEAPGLDGAFATGFNVITAGIWVVALRAYERLARRQQFTEADLYQKAYQRAARSFDRYFWNREHGYYTLYPGPGTHSQTPAYPLAGACHVGQLTAIWIANLLDLKDTFPEVRVTRALGTIEKYNTEARRLYTLSMPGQPEGVSAVTPEIEGAGIAGMYDLIRFACTSVYYASEVPLFERVNRLLPALESQASPGGGSAFLAANRHISQLALWYLVVASPAAHLNLIERQLNLQPDFSQRGQKRTHTLYTPNGFGSVSIEVKDSETLRCQIEFKMDIPLELSAITVRIPEGVGEIRCTLEVDDGPLPFATVTEPERSAASRLTVIPEGKFATTGFTLGLEQAGPGVGPGISKRLWIPRWFRR